LVAASGTIEKLLPLARAWIRDIFEPALDLPDVAASPESGEIVGIANLSTQAAAPLRCSGYAAHAGEILRRVGFDTRRAPLS
jgi:hypothetical protein